MKSRVVAGLVGVLALSCAGVAAAEGRVPLEDLLVEKGVITKDEAASVQKRKISSLIDRMTFSGDFRLRNETFYNGPGNNTDRNRWRFRLRLGTELKLDTVSIGVRLASGFPVGTTGTGDQVSTNKSFDNLSAPSPLFIDQAYARWQGDNSRWLTVTGGRMPNPFYRVYPSDIVWDDDFNPEGFAEAIVLKPGGTELFINFAQIVLDEDGTGKLDTDQWLFGQQVGVRVKPMKDLETVLAVAYLNTVNGQNGTFGQTTVQEGNTRCTVNTAPTPNIPVGCAANQLVNDYNVVELTAMVATKVFSLPVSVSGDFIVNTADTIRYLNATTTAETKNNGYQAGVILGKASDPQTWELAYFYKVAGVDATLADVADSDFGNGGLDRKGYITWVAYNPNKAVQVKAKYFVTGKENDAATPSDINRLQADVSFKF